jgi:hypothetical protein
MNDQHSLQQMALMNVVKQEGPKFGFMAPQSFDDMFT